MTGSQVELSGIDLQISYTKMKEFFQPVVDGLLQCLSEALLSLDEENMVGLGVASTSTMLLLKNLVIAIST